MISGVRPASEIGGVLRIATVSGAVAEIGFYPLIDSGRDAVGQSRPD